jgi:hypothetical protein
VNEKTLLWVLLAVAAANLYISYQMATGLQDASNKIQGAIKNPLGALGL